MLKQSTPPLPAMAKALLPYQSEQTMLNDRLARETSMFTTENSNELNGLIAKIQSGVTLSEGEANRANSLAIAEEGYQNALDVQNSKNSVQNSQAPVSTNSGDWMWNAKTSQWVPVVA